MTLESAPSPSSPSKPNQTSRDVWLAPTPEPAERGRPMQIEWTWTIALGQGTQSRFFRTLEDTLGIFWATYEAEAEIGDRIHVELVLPGDIRLKQNGVVTWRREASQDVWPGYGVVFDKDSAELRQWAGRFEKMRPSLYVPEMLVQPSASSPKNSERGVAPRGI